MIGFLIIRPIAVTMTFFAIIILGLCAISNLPVSLMPTLQIPEITIQFNKSSGSSREIESTLLNPLRSQLVQISHLKDIHSEARDEIGTITLKFDYGTDIDYAFIEVNEKIDQALASFSRDIERPKVIKASATDIPVFYLNLTLKQLQRNKKAVGVNNSDILFPVSTKFIELSDFSTQVIKKRLEQLPSVAMIDISGTISTELLIVPDVNKLSSLNISFETFERTIKSSNLNIGNLLIQDGQYQYNVRMNSVLRNKEDIENIYFKIDKHIYQLKDFAQVFHHPKKRKGMITSNGNDAISLAIIQQDNTQIGELKENIQSLISRFRIDYPNIHFEIFQDQTELLDYSIFNLKQDLFWGGILSFLIMFLFLKDYKSPLLISITLPTSLIISLGLFYLLNISINIISLSGLVLGIGMMIDNSIIVIDNIVQYTESGFTRLSACINGANEVFVPMLSSVFTTCSVFLPLIFISGISGELFYDEAMSIAIGAFVSLAIAVTLIPVYYYNFKIKESSQKVGRSNFGRYFDYEAAYEKSFKFIMRNQKATWFIILLLTSIGIITYFDLPKSKLPPVTKQEVLLKIDWNQQINVFENNRRVKILLSKINHLLLQNSCWMGEQQFLLNRHSNFNGAEALIYLKAHSPNDLQLAQNILKKHLLIQGNTVYKFEDADSNIFDLIFSINEPAFTVQLKNSKNTGFKNISIIEKALDTLKKELPTLHIPPASVQEHLVLKINSNKLAKYDIDLYKLVNKLKRSFNGIEILELSQSDNYIPVVVGDQPRSIREILSTTNIESKSGKNYPIKDLMYISFGKDLKTITAGKDGEYYPVDLEIQESEVNNIIDKFRTIFKNNTFIDPKFSGSLFSNASLIKELTYIFLLSVALLYFILAAQFESLILPLIILIEIPIDIFSAFIFLKLFGAGINLMSLIGFVVMGGIIINDSILKIDTINKLVKDGNSPLKSIIVGGKRRLKPILMTSATTILAMVPMLFTPGLGSELQKPLAVSLLGGMTVGTLISLYFIPLCYYYIVGKQQNCTNELI